MSAKKQDGPKPADEANAKLDSEACQGVPVEARPVLTHRTDAQDKDEQGRFIPLPALQLVPCFECLAIGARIGIPDLLALDPCAFCNDARYVRMDPEKFPIVERDPKHEEPIS